MSERIKLNPDETRLLLATAVCNHRCAMERGASVFVPYNELASKLLRPADYAILFSNLYNRFANPFIQSPKITTQIIAETLILAVATRQVTDLILDESLVK